MNTVNIITTSSTAIWTGKKIAGKHTGTIDLTTGSLDMDNDQLTGGEFTIDMSSITVTDLTGDTAAQLEGHLKSDDFFGTQQHPHAHLKITEAVKTDQTYKVIGHLTIKGNTNPIHFDLHVGENQATTTLVIDRSKFDVKFGSKSFFKSLGDNLIHDNFEVEVTLKF
jgi:polyisoprenoid-binding protein YceI